MNMRHIVLNVELSLWSTQTSFAVSAATHLSICTKNIVPHVLFQRSILTIIFHTALSADYLLVVFCGRNELYKLFLFFMQGGLFKVSSAITTKCSTFSYGHMAMWTFLKSH